MPEVLILLCVFALLLAAAGLLLWDFSVRRQSRFAVQRHLKEKLAPAPMGVNLGDLRFGAPPPLETTEPHPAAARWPLPGWVQGAVPPDVFYGGLLVMGVAVLLALVLKGSFHALALLVLLPAAGAFLLWLRIQKMRQELVRQLPGFLDIIVRLIVVGNSTQAAFQTAVGSAKQPLRGHMDRTMAMVRAGVDIDQALLQTARRVGVEEMFLLSAILGLGVRYGGRSDVLLERVANFMRDRKESEHELSAMSAETRLSAWVLGLLPLMVGGAILMLNGDYFLRMWEDPVGRRMVIGAGCLQLVGVVLLYRLARLD